MLHINLMETRGNYADLASGDIYGHGRVFVNTQTTVVQANKNYTPRKTQNALNQAIFDEIVESWISEVRFSSSLDEIVSNKHYTKIIEYGKQALPFIFADLRISPKAWFVALRKITGANPISKENSGSFGKMVEAWLSWAHLNGY